MIKIKDRYIIKNLLFKRSKLQDEYVKASAEVADRHEANYIRKYKRSYNLLTVWYTLLVSYIVIYLIFFLNQLEDKKIGVIVLSILGGLLLGFLGLIIFLKIKIYKLKIIWDKDLSEVYKIRDEANNYGEKAAKQGIIIMAITENSYILNLDELTQQKEFIKILYEYVDAINKYYINATIDDYIDYYKKWEIDYYQVI